jgi:hypothetical protein
MNTGLRLIFSSSKRYDYLLEQSHGSIKFIDNTPYNDFGSKSSMTILYDAETNNIISITLSGNYVGSDKKYNVSNLKFEHVEGPVFISIIDDTQPIIIGALDIKDIIKSMNETTNVGYGDNSPIITNDKGNLIISKDIEIQR